MFQFSPPTKWSIIQPANQVHFPIGGLTDFNPLDEQWQASPRGFHSTPLWSLSIKWLRLCTPDKTLSRLSLFSAFRCSEKGPDRRIFPTSRSIFSKSSGDLLFGKFSWKSARVSDVGLTLKWMPLIVGFNFKWFLSFWEDFSKINVSVFAI